MRAATSFKDPVRVRDVCVENWPRTRKLTGWQRDRVVWARSNVMSEFGMEIVEGVFASGWSLSSLLSEQCFLLRLSDVGRRLITFGPAHEVCGEGHDGCHATIIFFTRKQSDPTSCHNSVVKTATFHDSLAEALIRQLLIACKQGSQPQALKRLLDRLISTRQSGNCFDAHTSPIIHRVTAFVQSNLDQQLDRNKLAQVAGVSECHLSRIFRHHTGDSLSAFIRRSRLDRSRELLWTEQDSVKCIWKSCGFESESRFYTSFHQAFAMTPGEYRHARFGN